MGKRRLKPFRGKKAKKQTRPRTVGEVGGGKIKKELLCDLSFLWPRQGHLLHHETSRLAPVMWCKHARIQKQLQLALKVIYACPSQSISGQIVGELERVPLAVMSAMGGYPTTTRSTLARLPEVSENRWSPGLNQFVISRPECSPLADPLSSSGPHRYATDFTASFVLSSVIWVRMDREERGRTWRDRPTWYSSRVFMVIADCESVHLFILSSPRRGSSDEMMCCSTWFMWAKTRTLMLLGELGKWFSGGKRSLPYRREKRFRTNAKAMIVPSYAEIQRVRWRCQHGVHKRPLTLPCYTARLILFLCWKTGRVTSCLHVACFAIFWHP